MAEEIKTPAQASTAETTPGDCALCLKKPRRYTCPRCNIHYCSSECYKSPAHAQCSELFYRDCFMDGLKDMKPDGKQQMMDILQRQAQVEADEADEVNEVDVEDLAERLDGIDIDKDTQAVWERLTETEKSQFQSLLRAGDLGKFVEPWTAWWDHRVLVTEANAPDPFPAILAPIPKLDDILLGGKTPAEEIPYSIANVLYGYCYVCRLYNGDHAAFGEDVCEGLRGLCRGLGARPFASTSDAIHACLLVLSDTTHDLTVSLGFSAAVIQDACKIIAGSSGDAENSIWILAALSDVHKIFHLALKQMKKKLRKMKDSEPTLVQLKERKQCYFATLKKLEFFLSYVQEHGAKIRALVPELEVEYCTFSSSLVPREKGDGPADSKSAPIEPEKLIEELT